MKKLLLLALLISAVGLFFYFDLSTWFTLAQLKSQQSALATYRADHPIGLALLYLLTYIGVTALSLPGAALMTLTGGLSLAWFRAPCWPVLAPALAPPWHF